MRKDLSIIMALLFIASVGLSGCAREEASNSFTNTLARIPSIKGEL